MEKIIKFKEKLIEKDISIDINKHSKKTLDSLEHYLDKKYHLYDYDIKKIIDLLLYDFSEYDIKERLNEIKKLKKDSSSKKSFLLRYGEDEGLKRYNSRLNQQKYTGSKEYLIKTFGEEFGNQILKSKSPNNLNTLIERHGKEEGKRRYDEYLKNYKKGNSLEGYIEKYGEKIGKEKYYKRQEKYTIVNTKQYYIDTYGEEYGPIIFKDNTWYTNIRKKHGDVWYQSFLLEKNLRAKRPIKDKFISKYGKVEGIEKYKSYILKQKYAHTIEYFIEKYGEQYAEKEYLKSRKRLIRNLLNKKNTSNISKELFFKLKEEVGKNCNFVSHNKEICLHDKKIKKLFFYDFSYNMKIIEFHGNYWHTDPAIYDKDFVHPVLKVTAQEIWDNDKHKFNVAKEHGYDIKIVWETEYKKDKNKIINECLNFLNNE